MKIHKAYKFRIYPIEEQRILIHKTLGCCRYIWNLVLGAQKKQDAYWYITEEMVQNGQLPENRWKSDFFNAAKEQKELTKLKKQLDWLKEADSTALQNSLQDLGESFKQYYQKKKGKAFEEELKALNTEALFIKANITSEEEVASIFKQTVETFGKVDVVFNNAGIGRVHPSHDLEYSEWRKTVNVDLDGVFLVAREAIREMLKTGGGTIVNTASMYGWVGSPGSAAYNAAKGGVINLTRSLALEYAEQNIRINALCPGFIDTPIILEESKQALAAATPMKRLGKAEEMAKAVLFMASDDSSFMTGNSLIVDGGYTAQ